MVRHLDGTTWLPLQETLDSLTPESLLGHLPEEFWRGRRPCGGGRGRCRPRGRRADGSHLCGHPARWEKCRQLCESLALLSLKVIVRREVVLGPDIQSTSATYFYELLAAVSPAVPAVAVDVLQVILRRADLVEDVREDSRRYLCRGCGSDRD